MDVLKTRVQGLREQLVKLQLEKDRADARLKALLEKEADGTIETLPEVIRALEADTQLRALRNAVLNLETEQANFERQFGPNHPNVRLLDTSLKSIKDKIAEREGELTRRAIRLLKSIREAGMARVTARLLRLQQNFNEVNSILLDYGIEASQAAPRRTAPKARRIAPVPRPVPRRRKARSRPWTQPSSPGVDDF